MKRKLTETEKLGLLDEFKKHLDGVTDGKVNFTKDLKPKDKINIFYTPEAFSKTIRLVLSHETEIAWHSLIRRVGQNFEVYDVLTFPQTVGPAHVHTKMGRTFGDGKAPDPKKYYMDWYEQTFADNPQAEADLRGFCHSHVNMATFPSNVDLNQQKEEIELKGGVGFYMFQIWNKKLEINSFLYDLDAGVLYEKEDINVVVEDDEFTTLSHELLVEPEPEIKQYEKWAKNTQPQIPAANKNWQNQWPKSGDEWDDWGSYYKSYSLYHYCIPVSCGKSQTEYVVEAKSAVEAEKLFEEWVWENLEEISFVFDQEDPGEIEIGPACVCSKSDHVDITYEELTGVGCNELSEKL